MDSIDLYRNLEFNSHSPITQVDREYNTKSNDITETEKVIHTDSFKNISKDYEMIQNSKFLWKKKKTNFEIFKLNIHSFYLTYLEIIQSM